MQSYKLNLGKENIKRRKLQHIRMYQLTHTEASAHAPVCVGLRFMKRFSMLHDSF